MGLWRDRKIIALIVALMFCLVFVSRWNKTSHRQWTRAAWIRLDEQNSLEIGWETEWNNSMGYKISTLYNYLVWHREGEERKFSISSTDYQMHDIAVRCLRRPEDGIWVMSNGEVICSLEPTKNRFINSYGALMDYKWDYKTQERAFRPSNDNTGGDGVVPYPEWANNKNGINSVKMLSPYPAMQTK